MDPASAAAPPPEPARPASDGRAPCSDNAGGEPCQAIHRTIAAIPTMQRYTGKSQALMNASAPNVRASAPASPGRFLSHCQPGGSGVTSSANARARASVRYGRADTCACRSPSRKLKNGNSVIV